MKKKERGSAPARGNRKMNKTGRRKAEVPTMCTRTQEGKREKEKKKRKEKKRKEKKKREVGDI
jgi:hypothetical protein